jgi:DNA modification methylase
MLKLENNSANDDYTMQCKQNGIKIRPARFPTALPSFFIKLLTQPNDLVIDPFAGSNTCGAVAEDLDRRWLGFDDVEEYLRASRFRFNLRQKQLF